MRNPANDDSGVVGIVHDHAPVPRHEILQLPRCHAPRRNDVVCAWPHVGLLLSTVVWDAVPGPGRAHAHALLMPLCRLLNRPNNSTRCADGTTGSCTDGDVLTAVWVGG